MGESHHLQLLQLVHKCNIKVKDYSHVAPTSEVRTTAVEIIGGMKLKRTRVVWSLVVRYSYPYQVSRKYIN